MSISGGIDLSTIKQQDSSQVRVPSFSAPVNEKSLPSVVAISKTVPVLLEFFEKSPDPILESAVKARNGQVFLGQIDFAKEARVIQAFGAKSAPSLFALLNGQPAMVHQGALSAEQYGAILDQLIPAAKAQGLSGQLILADPTELLPSLPAPLQEALALVDSGEVQAAFDLLTRLKTESPKDVATSALLAQVTLMLRTMDLEHEKILEAEPKDFDGALELADVLAAIGDFQSCFDLLLSLFAQVETEQRETIKSRLLEYFEIAGAGNDLVRVARGKLATLIY